MKHRWRTPSPALVISLIALFVALGGTTYAATSLPKNSVGTKQLKKAAVTGPKIANAAVTAAKINTKGLTVPNALHAASADSATSATTAGSAPPSGSAGGALAGTYPSPTLASAEAWHEIGASGQPGFIGTWRNDTINSPATAGFYVDPFGTVHLKGTVLGGSADNIFTLPAGYRPAHLLTELVFCSACTGTSAYLLIRVDGSVAVEEGAQVGADTSLDGVTFRVGE